MKPASGTGKHTTIIEPRYLWIHIDNTIVNNQEKFFLECSYYWEQAVEATEFEPPINETFMLTEMRGFNILSLTDREGCTLHIDSSVDLYELLSEDTITEIEIKVLREIKEEANES